MSGNFQNLKIERGLACPQLRTASRADFETFRPEIHQSLRLLICHLDGIPTGVDIRNLK